MAIFLPSPPPVSSYVHHPWVTACWTIWCSHSHWQGHWQQCSCILLHPWFWCSWTIWSYSSYGCCKPDNACGKNMMHLLQFCKEVCMHECLWCCNQLCCLQDRETQGSIYMIEIVARNIEEDPEVINIHNRCRQWIIIPNSHSGLSYISPLPLLQISNFSLDDITALLSSTYTVQDTPCTGKSSVWVCLMLTLGRGYWSYPLALLDLNSWVRRQTQHFT